MMEGLWAPITEPRPASPVVDKPEVLAKTDVIRLKRNALLVVLPSDQVVPGRGRVLGAKLRPSLASPMLTGHLGCTVAHGDVADKHGLSGLVSAHPKILIRAISLTFDCLADDRYPTTARDDHACR
jgi:hypothetical protein